eukprot:m.130076 g.130076  ORF g.130076 m.130076 type:complete len:552 (+) comp29456_c0_seq1:134-1789(+)
MARVNGIVCLLVAACGIVNVTAKAAPNIMFILADDLGYNEMNFMNTTRGLITPNLDKLANNGVILKNYYVQPICSPTRSALMTGRYTIRLGTQSSVIYWDTPWGVDVNETFVSNNLKSVGYRTAMFGKWHLGMFKQEYTPAQRGFDEHMGYYQGCESGFTHVAACCTAGSATHDQDYICPGRSWDSQKDFRGYDWFKTGPMPNKGVSVPDFTANNTVSAYLIRDAAVDFIGRQTDAQPWFLYLPFQNIHAPYTCEAKYPLMYNNTNFTVDEQTMFGYISEMDFAVGEIIAKMEDMGFKENTVVIFSSDNGAPPATEEVNHQHGPAPGQIARNYPFNGYKTLIWEGGTRVPGFISSPLLPASVRGTISNELYHVTDWLPTIAAIAGAPITRNRPLDGHNLWDSIVSGGTTPSPRTEILYGLNPLNSGQAGPPRAGIRMGQYKTLCWDYKIKGINGSTFTGPLNNTESPDQYPQFAKGCALFDLDADPSEQTSLSEKMPDQLQKMLMRLEELAVESVEPLQWVPPFQGPDYFCADCPLHPGSKGPEEPWGPWL